jgi:hypothetical protein
VERGQEGQHPQMSASRSSGGEKHSSKQSTNAVSSDRGGAELRALGPKRRKLEEEDRIFDIEGIQLDFDRLCSGPFSCSGSMKWPQPSDHLAPRPLEIYYQTKEDEQGAGHMRNMRFPASTADLQELVRACDEAAFEINEEKCTAGSCSKAFELDARRFACSLDVGQTGILQIVQKILAPDYEHIFARLHKLNVQAEGGSSQICGGAPDKPPLGDDFLGWLVVCLPQSFTGGDLVVQHESCALRYPPLEDIEQEESIQWMAFCSANLEAVISEEITSGTRITLTYMLHRGKSKAVCESLEASADDDVHGPIDHELYRSLGRLISGDQKFKGILGFALEHLYVSGSSFKGRDLIVFNTLSLLERNHAKLEAKQHYPCDDDDGAQDKSSKVCPPEIKVDKMLVAEVAKFEWLPLDEDENIFKFYKLMYMEWDRFKDGDACYYRVDEDYYDEFLETTYGAKYFPVRWVQRPKAGTYWYKDSVATWGNEYTTHSFYAAGCLLLYVRTDKEAEYEKSKKDKRAGAV